ncbi:hypothetical protein A7976_13560 [Methylobacillus sp. MM3]|uniref:hypothetical protein n=1 Tax=Methylobacillus sp. MM3 TaxID=1848039 RepID=UPI0007DF85A4|nr:hypothetical protein [Methylobacillus sp. MM3]OAJ69655.1 hypothetical protein A7976_13560 [Methylobacillus sp. MM3]
MEATLDPLDDLALIQDIYNTTVRIAGIARAPELIVTNLPGDLAAQYNQLSHTITTDPRWAMNVSEAELYGACAHELAHARAGVQLKHGPRFQAFENDIVDRLRAAGIRVKKADPQGGSIPADDWKGWLKLLAWVVPAGLAVLALCISALVALGGR